MRGWSWIPIHLPFSPSTLADPYNSTNLSSIIYINIYHLSHRTISLLSVLSEATVFLPHVLPQIIKQGLAYILVLVQVLMAAKKYASAQVQH